MDLNEYLYPERINISPLTATLDGKFIKIIIVDEYPQTLMNGFLSEIISSHTMYNISIYMKKITAKDALSLTKTELANIETELRTHKNVSDPVYSKLTLEYDSIKKLQDDIVARKTSLYIVSLYIGFHAEKYLEVKKIESNIEDILKGMMFKIDKKPFSIISNLKAIYTLSSDKGKKGKYMSSSGSASMYPFVVNPFIMKNGILYGINLFDDTPVIINRFDLPSYNTVIFGETGSGKSFFTKITLKREQILDPNIHIFIIDPLGEFISMINDMSGEVITLNSNDKFINPLDPAAHFNNINEKIEHVKLLIKTVFPSIDDERLSLLDIYLYELYTKMKEPIFSDLLKLIKEKDDSLATLIYPFVYGSWKENNKKSSINFKNKYVALSLLNMNAENLPFYMILTLDYVYNYIRNIPGKKFIVIDEAHYLFKNDQSGKFIEYLSRHVRHYNTGIILISQHPSDLLSNKYGKTVINNSYIQFLFRHEHVDDEMKQFYSLNNNEIKFILDAKGGKIYPYSEAIVKIGTTKIPIAILSTQKEIKSFQT